MSERYEQNHKELVGLIDHTKPIGDLMQPFFDSEEDRRKFANVIGSAGEWARRNKDVLGVVACETVFRLVAEMQTGWQKSEEVVGDN